MLVGPSGAIEIMTGPPGAVVGVDGKLVGTSAPTTFQLPAGPHKLSVYLPGYLQVLKDINVPENETVTIQEILSRRKSARKTP